VTSARSALLARGLRLEYLTVGWNVVEGLIAVGAGLAAGSIALIGFGVDSFVETISGSVLIWRLRPDVASDFAAARDPSSSGRAATRTGTSVSGNGSGERDRDDLPTFSRRANGLGTDAKGGPCTHHVVDEHDRLTVLWCHPHKGFDFGAAIPHGAGLCRRRRSTPTERALRTAPAAPGGDLARGDLHEWDVRGRQVSRHRHHDGVGDRRPDRADGLTQPIDDGTDGRWVAGSCRADQPMEAVHTGHME
jgi:hypothetical protein